MSRSLSSMAPARDASGTSSCIRFRIRRNVDFPQPDGPINAVIEFACISKLIPPKTWWSPNHAWTSCALSVAGALASPSASSNRSRVCTIAVRASVRSPWSASSPLALEASGDEEDEYDREQDEREYPGALDVGGLR